MQRLGQVLKLKPGRKASYRECNAAVRPERPAPTTTARWPVAATGRGVVEQAARATDAAASPPPTRKRRRVRLSGAATGRAYRPTVRPERSGGTDGNPFLPSPGSFRIPQLTSQ